MKSYITTTSGKYFDTAGDEWYTIGDSLCPHCGIWNCGILHEPVSVASPWYVSNFEAIDYDKLADMVADRIADKLVVKE